ncbi:Dipeptide transport system permease protein DppB [subsurface metagenome]
MENIFCLPGMGQLILNATLDRDYGIISGVMFLFAIGLVLINLMVDLTYSYLDPRVHYK